MSKWQWQDLSVEYLSTKRPVDHHLKREIVEVPVVSDDDDDDDDE
jgi:hypothetical protein